MLIPSGKVLAIIAIAQTVLFVEGVKSQSPRSQCTLEQHGRWIEICLAKRPHHSDCGRDFRNDPLCWFQGMGANDVCFMPSQAKWFEKEVLASCSELKSAGSTAGCTFDEHIAWLQSCVARATSLKPGMRRRDMESTFRQDGGMSTRRAAIYTIEGCPGFKIRTEFTPSKDLAVSADVITSVAKLYLGRNIVD